MRATEIIRKKRDGRPLGDAEIRWMVDGLLSGQVADYQWSALLMAIYLRGMEEREIESLTEAMLQSGVIVDLSEVCGPKVDKHSTGGVGDKTSLILAPIVAACGVLVPMVSGRGLGHTGGTLDKLESIPGFRVDLELDAYRRVLESCGLVLIGQTAQIAPADRRIYQLRDATSTVESIPLIAASIMSKKLAEGIDALVLDVKTGEAALMTRRDESRELARLMCQIGRRFGKPITALITRMDQPLGLAVGNAIEVEEAIACLHGQGPPDLMELSLELAAEMLRLAGVAADLATARRRCQQAIDDGSALDRFRRVIEAQGGEPRVIDNPALLPQAGRRLDLVADRDGYLGAIRTRELGHLVGHLGAGRARAESAIDPGVGLRLEKKVGDPVCRGEPLARVYLAHESPETVELCDRLRQTFQMAESPPEPLPLIVERVAGESR